MNDPKLTTILLVALLLVGQVLAQGNLELLGVKDLSEAPGSGGGPSSSSPEVRDRLKLVIDPKVEKSLDLSQFRTCQGLFEKVEGEVPSRKGLDELNISGSSQFSEAGLSTIQSRIKARKIIVVDLRQESHGFINGMPVSWRNERNDANLGLSTKQATEKEKKQLEEVKGMKSVTLTRYAAEEANKREMEVEVKSVATEKKVVKTAGLAYERFAVTDYQRPTDEEVDRFIDLVKHLDGDAWLHFHCKAGKGRTTTFMALRDMMQNARNGVSFKDIVDRQYLIGGTNLMKTDDTDPYEAQAARTRLAFVEQFYEYCARNADGYKTSWSAWSARKRT